MRIEQCGRCGSIAFLDAGEGDKQVWRRYVEMCWVVKEESLEGGKRGRIGRVVGGSRRDQRMSGRVGGRMALPVHLWLDGGAGTTTLL
jgi:hypothetical protein